jgi:hypothetical protein
MQSISFYRYSILHRLRFIYRAVFLFDYRKARGRTEGASTERWRSTYMIEWWGGAWVF